MSLTDFNSNYIPIIQTVLMLFGLLSLIFVWVQIRQSTKWSRINTQHQFYALLPDEKLEGKFWAITEKYIGIKTEALTKKQVKKLYENFDEWLVVKIYLNKFEGICTAINVKTIDHEYAYRVLHSKINELQIIYKNYFEFVRTRKGDDELFIEIERTNTTFNKLQSKFSDRQ